MCLEEGHPEPESIPSTLATDVREMCLQVTKLEGLKDGDALTPRTARLSFSKNVLEVF
jgi:hypothetical protein